jgi:Na+-transporting NADH:ubiquinone oxidoreductase subunit F
MALLVRVDGTDRVFSATPGDDLLEVLQSHGEPIATSCGGVASCGLCRVTVVSGREALVPIKPQEVLHLGNLAKVIGRRLACQARLRDDPDVDVEIVVRVPAVDTRKASTVSRSPAVRETACHSTK